MQKSFNQSAQFITLFVRYTKFKSPLIYKALLIFYHAYPLIINVTFSFPKFVAACKKWDHFVDTFHNSKIIKAIFDFSEFLLTNQKSVYSIHSFLRYSQF